MRPPQVDADISSINILRATRLVNRDVSGLFVNAMDYGVMNELFAKG